MNTYFQNLLNLLNTEREEDKKSYLQFAEQNSVNTRREAGFTWYPVAIRGTELSRADYLTVEIERTTHTEIIHQLRSGASAVLFSQHDAKADRVEGIITWQRKDRLGLTLRTDELPDWASNGKLGVDLLFDDNSYDEMTTALKTADARLDAKDGNLVRILTGNTTQPTFNTAPSLTTHYSPLTNLNSSQLSAVQQIVNANNLAIVHGPPGTGKTTTLVAAIQSLYARDGKQILVTAPSNAAVDLLSEKLFDAGLNVLRIGNPARVSDKLLRLTLDSKMSEHPTTKDIKKLKKQAAEYKTMAHKYKRTFGKAEREQRKALLDEARKLMKEADAAESYIADDVLSKAAVITATLVGANHYTVKDRRYETVVIDEAGQALEPAGWVPILKGSKLILAGDHHQLPPTVKSVEAARNGLSRTLLEKAVHLHPEAVTVLEEQYRANELIMRYSSTVFYGGRLHAHSSVAARTLFPGDAPLLFIDTAGTGWEEKAEGTGIHNREEASFLIQLLLQMKDALLLHYTPETFPSVAVISPYRQQVELLREGVATSHELQPYAASIAVNTIDSFQGAERDIVFISLVRSNAEGTIGFLTDIRRTNVAMTRARKKLVMIGDSATLSGLLFYAGLIQFAQENEAYRSAWEYME
ncbi:MAG: AAA family ATPase [Williamsia sp.]|nr:AAA family ATPase [Williamsia sp.]